MRYGCSSWGRKFRERNIHFPRMTIPMSTVEWGELFADTALRQYLLNMCKAFTRIPEFQEDLYQEAWVRIGEAPGSKTPEYYMRCGFRAMNACYQRERRHWLRLRKGVDYKQSRTALSSRIHVARKKFKKKLIE